MNNKISELYRQFIYKRTYSRFIDEANRRENWPETVNRYDTFFFSRPMGELSLSDYHRAINHIYSQEVMPSMRALWAAGEALKENNLAGYNCAFIAIDHPDKFSEMLYVLMHGTGVGFSVERQYVGELPIVPALIVDPAVTYIIQDSKLGWKQAYEYCINELYLGRAPRFSYELIRPKGARLKVFGGRASGPAPLKELLDYTIRIFKGAKGRKLNSLEVHDLCCMVANCVVVGGVRRSACISFSNLSDQRMKHAKDGQFWLEHPQRAMANNSIAYTEKPDSAMFIEEWLNLMRSGSGERGIVNVEAIQRKANKFNRNNTSNIRLNPCAEALLADRGLCNLTEVVVRADDTKETLKEKIRSAVLLGCLQSTLTYFPNISESWKINAEEERLLGVSLTGTCDSKLLNKVNDKTKELLSELRDYAHQCASEFANALNIQSPRQVTLVKPSGCTTLETKVKTTNGIMSMDEIFSVNGHEAMQYEGGTWLELTRPMFVFDENNDKKQITKLFVNGEKEVYEILFEDGLTYKFTEEHKLKTNNGWKKVCDLTTDDEIISW